MDTENKLKLQTLRANKEFVSKFNNPLYSSEQLIKHSEMNDWICYKKKETVYTILKNKKYGFVEGKDYKIEKQDSSGGRPANEIYMTIDTAKCIRLLAPTEKGNEIRKYYIEMEKCFRQILSDQSVNKLINPIPQLNKYDFDPNTFKGKEVLYLIHIKDNFYKFGVTANILKRLRNHKVNLDYDYVIKCWDLINRTISKKVEDSIKLYAKHEKINATYNTETEVIEVANIDNIVKVINVYVDKNTAEYRKLFYDAKIAQKNELNKNKLELANKINDIINNLKQINSGPITEIVNSLASGIIDLKQKSKDNNINDIDIDELTDDDISESDDEEDNNCGELNSISDEVSDKLNDKQNTDVDMNNIELRKCQRCLKPYTEKEFGLNAKSQPYKNCKECRDKQKISDEKRSSKRVEYNKEYNKKYLEKNSKMINEKNRLEYVSQRKKPKMTEEEQKKKREEYYNKNKAEIIDTKRKYYRENRGAILQKQKASKLKKQEARNLKKNKRKVQDEEEDQEEQEEQEEQQDNIIEDNEN
jgi:phage anti-repressor protein